ncbi:YbjP/YqhG family protein [Rahnella variigena]|uniref:YbjP/YqhG family protein n=1 Tax=Rahnella variigena TaxID=574964 RepID=UPI0013302F22|nr:YbjP/YqhG family protein [Rahnella variigena]
MRILAMLFITLLTACTSPRTDDQKAIQQVTDFYHYYLNTFMSSPPPALQSAEMRRYVATDTLKQLEIISKLPEPDIFNVDYFTYSQDYDPAWIAAFKTGDIRDLMGGKVVDVWPGIQDGKHEHLAAYVRLEENKWKIYRVRDISNKFESPIFDNFTIENIRTNSMSE